MAQTGQVGGRQTLDTNMVNIPAAPPSAETVQDSYAAAGYIPQPGRAVTNMVNLPAAPPEVFDEDYTNSTDTLVEYPSAPAVTNMINVPAVQ